jgi:hypothetical protein
MFSFESPQYEFLIPSIFGLELLKTYIEKGGSEVISIQACRCDITVGSKPFWSVRLYVISSAEFESVSTVHRNEVSSL